MLGKSIMAGFTALALILGLMGTVKADLRPYLVTYGYYTPVQGEFELEQWTDSFTDRNGDTQLRSRTEIEYGVTDRLATAVYAVNKKPTDGSWNYDETKLELRYRLTEPGKRFWDTAGYLEMVRPSDSEAPYEAEVKGIFSHNFPKFNLTVNLVGEKELASGSEIEKGYAIGAAPYGSGRYTYSVELFGGEDGHYVMPALWIRPGRQNIGIGVGAGLTHSSDRLQVRTLYSMEF